MLDEQALQQRQVEPIQRAHCVDHRVLGRQLEHDGDVTELQIGVDQHDRSRAPPSQGDRQVGGHHRLAGAALGGEHGDDPAKLAGGVDHVAHGGHRRRHHQARGHPGHGLGQLRRLDRGLEHVLDTRAQRSLEHLGRQLVGHHDGAHVSPRGQQLLDGGQLGAAGERRTQDDHDGDRSQTGGQVVDGGERCGPLPQLHGQAATGRLVGIDHGDRHLTAAAPRGGPGARMWHVLAGLAGEWAGHDLGPAVPLGPYGVSWLPSSPGSVGMSKGTAGTTRGA